MNTDLLNDLNPQKKQEDEEMKVAPSEAFDLRGIADEDYRDAG